MLVMAFWLCNASSCKEAVRATTPAKAKKSANFLLGDKTSYNKTWRLVSRFDPYNGGNTQTYEAEKATFLTLERDGTFIQQNAENHEMGHYYLNKTKDAIALVIEKRVEGKDTMDIQQPSDELLFRHQIRTINADSLVLAWQGRHGYVLDTYLWEL